MASKWATVLFSLLMTRCVGIPAHVKPVDHFNIEKYLGTWYEIARLDHPFERGLTRVTADYSLREDGRLRVVNRGYSVNDGKWKEVEGQADFVDRRDQGYLKVTFFWPFYSSYIVFELDHIGYQYALVCGSTKSYLWILARTPKLSDELKGSLVKKAASLGFSTEKLIFVEHE